MSADNQIVQAISDLQERIKELEAQLKLADKAMSMLDSLYSEESVVRWFSTAVALEKVAEAYRTARQKV